MSAPALLHLVIGPTDHGVVRFAVRLAELMSAPVLHFPHPEQVDRQHLAAIDPGATVHLQYTDALYAPHTTAAAEVFVDLCGQIPGPVSVTLHDLPDPQDEPGRYRRRARSYARVARAVAAVAVSSEHELALLKRLLDEHPGPRSRVQVVPLPLEPPRLVAGPDRPAPNPEVAVFGFIYPGKGHDDVLAAMSGLSPAVAFTALGRIADGHDQLGQSLTVTAAKAGRRLEITGFVGDDELLPRLQQVAVPVAPARMISASGSINTWIAAGRRPLVAAGSYTREFAARYPGAVRLYQPGELPGLIEAVLADPGLSWLPEPAPVHLTGPAVAHGYRELILDLREPVA